MAMHGDLPCPAGVHSRLLTKSSQNASSERCGLDASSETSELHDAFNVAFSIRFSIVICCWSVKVGRAVKVVVEKSLAGLVKPTIAQAVIAVTPINQVRNLDMCVRLRVCGMYASHLL